MFFPNFKTHYKVSTPIYLKTNNNVKKLYFILHVHIRVYRS